MVTNIRGHRDLYSIQCIREKLYVYNLIVDSYYYYYKRLQTTYYLIQLCIIIIILTRNLCCSVKCRSKRRGAGHCTSAKRMTRILRHVAEAFSPARQGTILNYHRVIGIATNASMVVNCSLVLALPDAI